MTDIGTDLNVEEARLESLRILLRSISECAPAELAEHCQQICDSILALQDRDRRTDLPSPATATES